MCYYYYAVWSFRGRFSSMTFSSEVAYFQIKKALKVLASKLDIPIGEITIHSWVNLTEEQWKELRPEEESKIIQP